jgi:hypothetical protein
MSGNMPFEPQSPLGQRALKIIQSHNGPIRTLSADEIDADERAKLKRFGLLLQPESCQTFHSKMDAFLTCSVVKAPRRTGAE